MNHDQLTTCDFCGAECEIYAPTTYSNGYREWCQECEDKFQAEADALTPAELADWLTRQDGLCETRQGYRIIEILRSLPRSAPEARAALKGASNES